MKRLIALLPLLAAVPVQASPFKPFGAVVNGSDCTIQLTFPVADFCSFQLSPSDVIGWYGGNRQDEGSANYIYTKEAMHKVKFFSPGADNRFVVEFAIWSGRNETPVPRNGVHLGN